MPAGVELSSVGSAALNASTMRTRHRLQSSVPVAVDVEVHCRKYVPKEPSHVQADARSRRRLWKVRSMPDVVGYGGSRSRRCRARVAGHIGHVGKRSTMLGSAGCSSRPAA